MSEAVGESSSDLPPPDRDSAVDGLGPPILEPDAGDVGPQTFGPESDSPSIAPSAAPSSPPSMWIALAATVLVLASVVAAIAVGGDSNGSVESADAIPLRPTSPPPTVASSTSALFEATPTTAGTARSTLPTASTTTIASVDTAPPQDVDDPSVVARPVPVDPPPPPPDAPPPPWAASTRTTRAGLVATDVGCAADTSPAGLDQFFAARVGPVLGWDYQHVIELGGGRSLWLFQDTFIDHSGTAATLDRAGFSHNVALVQDGACFSLMHRGTTSRPQPFEQGNGSSTLSNWYWPMGGEVHDGRLHVVWVQMVKDQFDPNPPDGLGWHPTETWIATYDVDTLARLEFLRAPNAGVTPIYGYAMASDSAHTYLFGNSFEQNLAREGGYWNGPHSATQMFLARVPRGRVFDAPEYRTADGWTGDPAGAVPILARHWAEFPFQPRLVDGQWVGVAAIDGYWDDKFSVDVANQPWGPWTTIESRPISPRGGDPKMNTYHAQLLPRRDAAGNLVVSISNNARNMLRDAWPRPDRYRPVVFTAPWVLAPPPITSASAPATTTTVAATTTVPATTTNRPTATVRPTTTVRSTTTTTTVRPTTTVKSTTTTTTTTTTSTTTTVNPPTTTTSPSTPPTASSTSTTAPK